MPDWTTDCKLTWVGCSMPDWSTDCELA